VTRTHRSPSNEILGPSCLRPCALLDRGEIVFESLLGSFCASKIRRYCSRLRVIVNVYVLPVQETIYNDSIKSFPLFVNTSLCIRPINSSLVFAYITVLLFVIDEIYVLSKGIFSITSTYIHELRYNKIKTWTEQITILNSV